MIKPTQSNTLLAHALPSWLQFATFLALALGVAITVYGVTHTDVFHEQGYQRVLELFLCFLVALGISVLLARRLPKQDRAPARFLHFLSVIASAFAIALGPMQLLSVGLLTLAALAIGSALVRNGATNSLSAGVISLLCGFCIIGGIAGWLLYAPIHYGLAYAVLLVIPVLIRRKTLISYGRSAAVGLKNLSKRATYVHYLGIGVLAFCALPSWLPTIMSDDVYYHLQMPYQLAAEGRYRFDVDTQLWAVAPWLGDVLHSIGQLMAGESARGALNLIWHSATLILLYAIAQQFGLSLAWRFAAVALAATQPIWIAQSQGMQSELPTAACLAAVALLTLGAPKERDFRLAGVFFGAAMGLKISNVLLFAPFALIWLIQRFNFKQEVSEYFVGAKQIGSAALWTLLVGGSSYVSAYVYTGNPVWPFGSAWFPTPVQDAAQNPLYNSAVDLSFFYDLQFQTGRFFECFNGAAGLQYLVLLAALLPLLFAKNLRRTALVWLPALLGVVLLMAQIRYLRYPLPALMLLSIAIPIGLYALPTRTALTLICGVIALNFLQQVNGSHALRSGVLPFAHLLGRESANDAYLLEVAPVRLLARQMDDALVVQPFSLGDALPEFDVRAGAPVWHNQGVYSLWNAAIFALPENKRAAYQAVLAEVSPSDVIIDGRRQFDAELLNLIEERGELVERIGYAQWWRMRWPSLTPSSLNNNSGSIILPTRRSMIVRWRATLKCDTGAPGINVAIRWFTGGVWNGQDNAWIGCDPVTGLLEVDQVVRSRLPVDRIDFAAEAGSIVMSEFYGLTSRYPERNRRKHPFSWRTSATANAPK
jgi:hypothetical protein